MIRYQQKQYLHLFKNSYYKKKLIQHHNKSFCRLFSSNNNKKEEESLDGGFTKAIKESMNIPNSLTMARIVLTPGLSYLILTDHLELAIYGCFFTGILDYFDGYFARKYNLQTIVGSFLDPLADKLFIGTILLSLTYVDLIPYQLTALIVGRDVALLAGSFIYRGFTKEKDEQFFATTGKKVLEVEPTQISKYNTVLQMLVLGGALTQPVYNFPGEFIQTNLCYVVAGTTILSGLSYINLNSLKTYKKEDK